jgi:hypothetical protein
MKLTGENRRARRKTYPSATLSTTNPTWPDPGSNPGIFCERPATNRLSRGTANSKPLLGRLMYSLARPVSRKTNVLTG